MLIIINLIGRISLRKTEKENPESVSSKISSSLMLSGLII